MKKDLKPYLIQRGTKRNQIEKIGLNSIIWFHYMGSASFEFDVFPNSIERIEDNINSYVYFDVPIKDKVITVFLNDKWKTQIKTYLNKLALDEFRLEEFSDFNSYINDDLDYLNTDFWWDLKNDIIFWVKENEFENKFKDIFK